MQFTLFDLLLLIGFTQGIITSVLLFFSKKNRQSNRMLAIALFAFCMLTVKMLLHTLSLWENVSYLSYFPLGIELLLTPLLYFYCISLMTPNFQFQRKNCLHFLPFVISQSYAFFIYFNVVGMPILAEKDVFANSFWFNPIKETEDHLAVISIFTYLVLVFNKLKSYKSWLNENISDTNYPSFNWIRNIFGLCALLGVFLTVNLTLDFFFDLRHT